MVLGGSFGEVLKPSGELSLMRLLLIKEDPEIPTTGWHVQIQQEVCNQTET